MGTYKVIQDIEAEDKLLGPLTLRQFIYAAIVIVLGFISFKLVLVNPLLVIPFLPPMGFFGLLAAPFGHDQSSEVWLLAKFRFLFKPRRRIWDQSGLKELVTITVPKKVEQHLTDGLSQTEVKSRLKALANTIDSRGWAIKSTNVNLADPVYSLGIANTGSDRLVEASSLPQDVPTYDVLAADDIMDETSNSTAQQLSNMINQSEQAHRQSLIATVQNAPQPAPTGQPAADYWFMNQSVPPAAIQPGYAAFSSSPTITPGTVQADTPLVSDRGADEQQLLEKIHRSQGHHEDSAYGHTKVLQPYVPDPVVTQDDPAQAIAPSDESVSSKGTNPDIIRLANNDDLNVATIAREANKAQKLSDDGEVVISLH